jgi:hypothetical protein
VGGVPDKRAGVVRTPAFCNNIFGLYSNRQLVETRFIKRKVTSVNPSPVSTMKRLSSSLVTEIGRRFIDNASPSEFKDETTPVWYKGEFLGNIEKPFLEFYVVNNTHILKDHIELEIHTDETGLIYKVDLI